MKKTGTVKLLKFLNNYYSKKFEFPKESEDDTKLLIATWHDFLKDYDYKVVSTATKKLVIDKEWPPTPGEIINEISNLKRKDCLSWEESYQKTMRLISRHGIQYGLSNIKKELPQISIKAAGLMGGFSYMGYEITDQNRDFAMNRYKEIYNRLLDKQEEFEKLPPSQRKEVESLCNKFKNERPQIAAGGE